MAAKTAMLSKQTETTETSCGAAPMSVLYANRAALSPCVSTAQSDAKFRKDQVQAQALVETLLEDRPQELQGAWNEAIRRGPKWEEKLLQGAKKLRDGLGDRLIVCRGLRS